MNIPAIPILFHYSGIIKLVYDKATGESHLIRAPYYAHFVQPVGKDSVNHIDSDQPMVFNYNNDLITRFYSARLRRTLEGPGETL